MCVHAFECGSIGEYRSNKVATLTIRVDESLHLQVGEGIETDNERVSVSAADRNATHGRLEGKEGENSADEQSEHHSVSQDKSLAALVAAPPSSLF